MDIDDDGFLCLMADDGDLREDMKFDKDEVKAKQDDCGEDEEVYVSD